MEEEHKEATKTRPHRQCLRGESKPKGNSRDKRMGEEDERWKWDAGKEWQSHLLPVYLGRGRSRPAALCP